MPTVTDLPSGAEGSSAASRTETARVTKMTPARYRVHIMYTRVQAGKMDRLEFYAETMDNTPKLIAEVTGIDIEVIRDRRRYLRQLAAM